MVRQEWVLVEMLGLNRRPPRNSRQAIGCDGLLYPELDSSYGYSTPQGCLFVMPRKDGFSFNEK